MPWRFRVMIILRYLIHSEFKWIGNVLMEFNELNERCSSIINWVSDGDFIMI